MFMHIEATADEATLGRGVRTINGVFKFTLGRPDVLVKCSRCGGLEIDSAMGYNTWAAFQGSQQRAAVCGDFAMLELEIAPIIGELRAGGIEVVAVHNHMFFEEPPVIFLHYWGVGTATNLATVLRRALNSQKQAIADNNSCCSS